MNDLEKWFNGSELVKSNWANKKLQWDIKDVLVATSENWYEEDNLEQKIWNIDETIENIFEYCLKSNVITPERVENERNIYNQEVKPRLQDKKILEYVDSILSKNNKLLPSRLLREIESLETIIMIKKSAKHVYPSVIMDNYEIYNKFAKVKELDEKQVISRCINKWFHPRRLDDEYEDYLYIKNYEYKNEELRSFILALIKNNNVDPSLVVYFFDIFKDYANCWTKEKKYIRQLIKTKWL